MISRLLLDWVQRGLLLPGQLAQALLLTGAVPDAQRNVYFLDRLLLVALVVCGCSSAIFFVAYNWDAMGRLHKFALAQGLLVLSLWPLLCYPLQHRVVQAGMLASGLLLGALLALIGQTYQTGADTFELFLVWALLLVPWAWLARSRALLVLVLLLLNLALLLMVSAFSFPVQKGFTLLLVANLLMWLPLAWRAWHGPAVFWKYLHLLLLFWIQGIALTWTVFNIMPFVMGAESRGWVHAVWGLLQLGLLYVYAWRGRSRAVQLMVTLAVTLWLLAWALELLDMSAAYTYLLLGLILLGLVLAAVWVFNSGRRRQASGISREPRVWQQLQSTGLVQGELAAEHVQPPLYMRLFVGGLLLLAALMFVSFVGTLLYSVFGSWFSRNDLSQLMVGLALLAVAALLSRLARPTLFLSCLVLALGLTGEGLQLETIFRVNGIGWWWSLLQIPIFLLVKNTQVRSLTVPILMYVLLERLDLMMFTTALWVGLPLAVVLAAVMEAGQMRWARWHEWIHPLRRGLNLCVWLMVVTLAINIMGQGWLTRVAPQSPGLVLLQLLAPAGFLLWFVARLQGASVRLFALALGALLLLAGWQVPGLAGISLLLALAWQQGQRAYWIVHLLGVLLLLFAYYYHLEQTLLFKSAVLAGMALVMLLLRIWLLRLPLAQTVNGEEASCASA